MEWLPQGLGIPDMTFVNGQTLLIAVDWPIYQWPNSLKLWRIGIWGVTKSTTVWVANDQRKTFAASNIPSRYCLVGLYHLLNPDCFWVYQIIHIDVVSLVVCIFNLLKCIGICYTALYHSTPDDRPLANIGDAICSFLQDPDKTTRRMSLVSKQQIAESDEIWRKPTAQMYQFRQPRWLYAVSWKRWSLCIGL